MRVSDMIGMAFSAVRQQKARTALTTLGVIFGSFVLAASLSIGQGVQQAIRAYVLSQEVLRQVNVWEDWAPPATQPAADVTGNISAPRRERLRTALADYEAARSARERVKLTEQNLARLAAIPHVARLVAMPWQSGHVVLGEAAQQAHIVSARPDDALYRQRLVAGRFFETPDEPSVVVSEFLLYRLGVVDDADFERAVGRTLRIEVRPRRQAGLGVHIRRESGETTRQESAILEKLTGQLPGLLEKLDLAPAERALLQQALATQPAEAGTLFARPFTIVGIVRAPGEQEHGLPWDALHDDGDVVLPYETAVRYFFDTPSQGEQSIGRAVLVTDSEEHVEGVFKAVEDMGFRAHAPFEYIRRQRLMYLLIFGAMTCVAVTAVVVAGIGIANTMLITVLERTREIGIMKAVGADSRHLQLVFLVEGAIIGAAGAAIGLFLTYLAAYPGDAWIRSLTGDLKIDLKQSIFVFPPWLVVGVPLFVTAITVAAAVYPSRRAARIDPVAAIRHE